MTRFSTLLLGLVALAATATCALAGGSTSTIDPTALDLHTSMQVALVSFGALFLLLATITGTIGRAWVSRVLMVAFAATALLTALHYPALAQVAATADGKVLGTTGGSAVVTLPYGEYIAGAQAALTTLLTVVATAVLAYLPIPIRWAVNLYGVDKLVKDVVGFAVAATPGASRDAKLDINVGSAVLARALNKAIEDASPRIIKAAGGIEGLQSKILGQMHLAPDVTAQQVVANVPTNTMSDKG